MKIVLISQDLCSACEEVKNVLSSVTGSENSITYVECQIINTPISQLFDTTIDFSVQSVPSVVVVSDSEVVYSLESNSENIETMKTKEYWEEIISKYST